MSSKQEHRKTLTDSLSRYEEYFAPLIEKLKESESDMADLCRRAETDAVARQQLDDLTAALSSAREKGFAELSAQVTQFRRTGMELSALINQALASDIAEANRTGTPVKTVPTRKPRGKFA